MRGFCVCSRRNGLARRAQTQRKQQAHIGIGQRGAQRLFDAAHLIAPVAIASSLGLGHVKVPIVAPFGLGVNGNAITVSPALYAAIAAAAGCMRLKSTAGCSVMMRRADARAPRGSVEISSSQANVDFPAPVSPTRARVSPAGR